MEAAAVAVMKTPIIRMMTTTKKRKKDKTTKQELRLLRMARVRVW